MCLFTFVLFADNGADNSCNTRECVEDVTSHSAHMESKNVPLKPEAA